MKRGPVVSWSSPALAIPRVRPPLSESILAGAPRAAGGGVLPLLTLLASLGLLLVALGMSAARTGAGAGAELLFWLGLLLVVAPGAVRLAGTGAGRGERIGLLAAVGVGLYLAKVLHSPYYFSFYDELQHWRTADDLLRTGRLFGENPVLPVSPFFPGLENATGALASLSGLSIFGAGLIVVGVARLVLVLALYHLYEIVSGSARVAGIATLVYMANPNFLFFDAQFAYESLALPFAVLTLYAAARRTEAPPGGRVGLTLAVLAGLAATVVTHHLTAYVLTAFLVLWALADHLAERFPATHPGSVGLATLAAATSLAWLLYVGSLTLSYLTPIFGRGAEDVLRWLTEGTAGRRLFQDAAGQRSPAWEQLLAYGAVASLLLLLPLGLAVVWRRYRHDAAALTLTFGALAYPVSLALRLTPRGLEISNRTSEFLFVGVGFVVALACCIRWRRVWGSRRAQDGEREGQRDEVRDPEGVSPGGAPGPARPLWGAAFGAWIAVLFAGGIVLGWPAYARLPGPYQPAAPVRSLDLQSVGVAEWVRRELGPGNRIASDVSNQLTLAAYGGQQSETNGYHVPRLFFSPAVGEAERETVRNWRIEYVLVDRRLSQALPMIGIYYGMWEPDGYDHSRPLSPQSLTKFDGMPDVHRLLDTGDIVVYDVEALAGDP